MKRCLLPLFALIALVFSASLPAQSVDSIPIKVPAGMTPVLKKDANGSWILEVVASDAAAAPAAAPQTPTAAEKAAAAKAQDEAFEKSLGKNLESLNWEHPIPASPAFVALGISPEEVATPATPTALAVALLNGTDRQGHIQTGFALDFSPYATLSPDLSHAEYRDNWFKHVLYNTTVSLGTTKAGEDGDAQRVALGISVRLWNSAEDDFNDLLKNPEFRRLRQRLPILHADPRFPERNAEIEAENLRRDAEFESGVTDMFTRVRTLQEQVWGRSTASIAWAPTWLSESGKWNDLRYDGSLAWASASFQLDGPGEEEMQTFAATGRKPRFWHLLGQAQYRDRESVKGEGDDKKTYLQNSLLVAGRVRYGTTDLNGSAEIGYLRLWDSPHGDGDAMRYGLSLEKRVADNTWLVISAGHDMGLSGTVEDESFAVGGIRFGFGQKATPIEKEAIREAAR